jgi:hypothetical protein
MGEIENMNKIQDCIKRLESIFAALIEIESLEKKLYYINNLSQVSTFNHSHGAAKIFFKNFNSEDEIILKLLVVIGQEHILLNLFHDQKALKHFLSHIKEIDEFYETSHGLLAYQITVLKLILDQPQVTSQTLNTSIRYLEPPHTDISQDSREVRSAIRNALQNLIHVAEIYPIGGAGERLNLRDTETDESLPVALLPFLGNNLLDGLIRDVQAREFLYFKLTGKQLITPIAMMTSFENHNDTHIHNICEKRKWFNRSKDNFFIFTQPMVPVVTAQGNWLLASLAQVNLKPSGHGVIWKLAQKKGVFNWFKQHQRTKMLTRQINNPIAGVDSGILSFMGIGFRDKKVFGFASCDRFVNTSEGMDVLIEENTAGGFLYKLTNVEYTEFVKKGIDDEPEHENSKFSKFPANTNLLFVDINEAEKAIEKNPVPGLLINMKSSLPYISSQGVLSSIKAGRLESTMQNIADEIVDIFPKQIEENEYKNLRSYLTYNSRVKTISVTKRCFNIETAHTETPENCFYDILQNHYDLLQNHCQMDIPPLNSFQEYLEQGPSFHMNYHPACGPLFSIIAQKIRGGKMAEKSELQLEIAEIDIENIDLKGSLIIEATDVMGGVDERGILNYGKYYGKCTLKNVKVVNKGINKQAPNCYWKNEINRLESLNIKLIGDAEFIAENVTFNGNFEIEVKDGERIVVTQEEDDGYALKIHRQDKSFPIRGQAYWSYSFDNEDRIVLNRVV